MAMLGNLRTHIRNFAENAVFMPARKLKNTIGAGIETGTNKVLIAVAAPQPLVREDDMKEDGTFTLTKNWLDRDWPPDKVLE